MQKKSKNKPARVKRPVIAGRVPKSLREQLRQAAAISGRTLSDELVWRATQSFVWEKTFGEHAAFRASLIADEAAIENDRIEALLRRKNWKKVHGARFFQANWISPDNHEYPADGFVVDHGQPPAAAESESSTAAVQAKDSRS